MTIAIYTGLSISFKEAKTILDATYYPPVKRGDIDELLSKNDNIEIIGIIDGVFHQSPAVAHKEILRALKRNITVVGGASMGALRACELYPYGMIGIGTIFNDYKKGVIDSDDDVSVALNPDTLEQLSQPWINLKYNFDNARKDKIITQEEEDELLKIAKDTGAYSVYGEDDVMYCFYDRDLAIWFDSTREEILKILSSICEEIGIHGLGFPRKRYEW